MCDAHHDADLLTWWYSIHLSKVGAEAEDHVWHARIQVLQEDECTTVDNDSGISVNNPEVHIWWRMEGEL